MKQLEFFEYNFRKEIQNAQKRIARAEKKLDWLLAIEELRQKALERKTIEMPRNTQMEMFG